MMTDRVKRLKERFLGTRPNITPERLLLATEAYKKYAGEAVPIFRAKVLAHVLDNLSITIHKDEMIVGVPTYTPRGANLFPEYTSVKWLVPELDDFPVRPMDAIDITDEDKEIIADCLNDYWTGKAMEDLAEEILPEETNFAIEHDIIAMGIRNTCSGETVPNYKKLLEKGLEGYIADCKKNIEEQQGGTKEKQEKVNFWKAAIIVCEAVIRFANRYADRAEELAAEEKDEKRRKELLTIARNCRRVPQKSPSGFYEALQFVWFIHLTFHIEAPTTACSFGRFDQTLYPYMEMDMKNGIFDEDAAQEILECFFLKCGEVIEVRDHWYSVAFAGFPMWAIIMVGGQDSRGRDATNKLSYMCLTAGADVQTAQPVLAMRVHKGTPEALFRQAAEMVQAGMANPGFFNDDVAIPIVLSKGATMEEARNWFIVGCTQPQPGGGAADGTPDAGYVNFAKMLELVLHDGMDPATGRQIGLRTGDPTKFSCKEDIIEAVKKQTAYFYEMIRDGFNMIGANHILRLPVIFASLVMDDCIKNGMTVQEGGTRYKSSGLFSTGHANLADSIAAIEQVVFQDKTLSMQELINILDKNFEGEERIRQLLLNKPPKFGNDNDYVDGIARDFVNWVADMVQDFRDYRGGRFDYTLMSQTVNVPHGQAVGATPDGRLAGQPLNDNASPMMGRDICGPTATVKSVASLDQVHFYDGALFNMRFDPRGVQGEKGIETIKGVIKTYFDAGGQHIQINVVDDETLKKAQTEPENYRGLIVRVAGYMAYFTELDKVVQDAIIERTAHLG